MYCISRLDCCDRYLLMVSNTACVFENVVIIDIRVTLLSDSVCMGQSDRHDHQYNILCNSIWMYQFIFWYYTWCFVVTKMVILLRSYYHTGYNVGHQLEDI